MNSNVDLNSDEPAAVHHPVVGILDCTCGMPLCICEAPAAPMETVPLQQEDELIGETGDCNNGSWSLDTGISSLGLCSQDQRPSRRSGFPIGSSCILSLNQ